MLVHLAIKDFAIISSTAVDLTSGLNVLTGETGAGKSIVVDALNLVMGGRATSTSIRLGCEQAEVQVLFRLHPDGEIAARLRDQELCQGDEDESVDLVVRRIVARNGRGRVWINGVLVNVGTLAALTRGLVDISSQYEHATLLDTNSHLDLLDRFGGLDAERSKYSECWSRLSSARQDLKRLRTQDTERLQRQDYLRFQLQEIDELSPVAGEEQTLSTERDRLAHAGRLVSDSRAIEAALAGGGASAQKTLLTASGLFDGMLGLDATVEPLARRFEEVRIELTDIAYEIRGYGDQIDIDPHRLETVEERLHDLFRLSKKHGLDPEGLVEKSESIRDELSALESLGQTIEAAEGEVGAREQEALDAAKTLSRAREQTAETLTGQVNIQLSDLAMEAASVQFDLSHREALGPQGLDAGQILIQTNTGEGYQPLVKIASGGELSRVLLALKSVLAEAGGVYVGVYDEVDTGVGGAVADVVGNKLAELARHHQVIAITHLPQIASQADHHLHVSKRTETGRTCTSVRALSASERLDEIARMLGGVEITDRTRAHAAELLTR